MEQDQGLMKTFLDSVHGRIKVPKWICDEIVDTPEFQRLRRIEQNSCRAVYPSARHDRFIHSLGVYYIGSLIVERLNHFQKPEDWGSISKTYKLACLLHDIGHTPFSHTFEGFYNSKLILEEIKKTLDSKEFAKDTDIPINELTHHELLSAWLSLIVFKDRISCIDLNWELFVRMIIGVPYKNEKSLPDSTNFRNIMIELIHGTIDADGLDYVCRDVWAGGYNNFTVDLHRLIDSIEVIYSERDGYTLAFNSKSVNEIETVLNVKNFQFLYVLNHHKVLLEQHYLVEGVKSAASYHLGIEDRETAIHELCDFKSFIDNKLLKVSGYNLLRPCDDDFIALMKQTNIAEASKYIEQWFSRKHSLIPLWKSKMEFFYLFQDVIDALVGVAPTGDVMDSVGQEINAKEMVSTLVGGGECISFIKDKFGRHDSDIVAIIVKPKLRKFDPEKVKISFNGNIIDYNRYVHEGFTVNGYNAPFYYLYIESDVLNKHNKDEIIDAIKNFIINKVQGNTKK